MENRKGRRYRVLCPISFLGEHTAGEGIMLNLSKQGCSVGTGKNVQERTCLTVHVSLPGEALPIKVDVAVVRWAMEPACGLEFLRMQPEDQERLWRFVSTLETSPSPLRTRTG